MTLRLKPEVRFADRAHAVPIIACVVECIFAEYVYAAVITSAGDGTHKPDSLHYRGLALDFRTKHVAEAEHKAAIVQRIKEALPQCDVLLEGEGTDSEHLHVEWDPDHDNRAGRAPT